MTLSFARTTVWTDTGSHHFNVSNDSNEETKAFSIHLEYSINRKWLYAIGWQFDAWIRLGSIVVDGRRAHYERLRFDRASICNKLSSSEKAASPVMKMSGFFLFKL